MVPLEALFDRFEVEYDLVFAKKELYTVTGAEKGGGILSRPS
jgi:hypothetical protein